MAARHPAVVQLTLLPPSARCRLPADRSITAHAATLPRLGGSCLRDAPRRGGGGGRQGGREGDGSETEGSKIKPDTVHVNVILALLSCLSLNCSSV